MNDQQTHTHTHQCFYEEVPWRMSAVPHLSNRNAETKRDLRKASTMKRKEKTARQPAYALMDEVGMGKREREMRGEAVGRGVAGVIMEVRRNTTYVMHQPTTPASIVFPSLLAPTGIDSVSFTSHTASYRLRRPLLLPFPPTAPRHSIRTVTMTCAGGCCNVEKRSARR